MVAHEILSKNDESLSNLDFIKEMLEKKNGTQNYTYNGENKWMTYTFFEPWGWTIAFSIPHNIKYADAYRLRSILTVIVSSLMLIAILIIGVFVYRMVSVPIRNTANILKDIAEGEGDLTRRLPDKRKDEIGALARWFNAFVDKIQLVVRDISGTAEQLNGSSQNLSVTAGKMSEGVSQLNNQTEISVNAAYIMNENMEKAVKSTQKVTENIHAVAAAIEETTTTISEVANNAERSATIANEASRKVQTSHEVLGQLGIAAEEIGKVIEVIKDIADQTNLLALNATIEAARAGDAGKGFAVVANEVKELARQTAEATQGVAERICAIQTSSERSIQSIDEIRSVIEQVNEFSRNIASAVEEQSVTTREISQNVSTAASISNDATDEIRQSATNCREISDAVKSLESVSRSSTENASQASSESDTLLKLAEKLNHMVGQFRY